jgi:hypothetical protein
MKNKRDKLSGICGKQLNTAKVLLNLFLFETSDRHIEIKKIYVISLKIPNI